MHPGAPSLISSLAALALVGALAASTAWGAEGCAAPPAPRVTLTPVYPDPVVDITLDVAALKQRSREVGTEHGEHGQPLGLTLATLVGDFEDQVEFALLDPRTPGARICGAAKEVRVRFGFEEVVMHIAREVTGDRCLYGEVYRHESRHVQVDRELIAQFVPRIEADLRALLARIGAVRGRSTEAVSIEIRDRIRVVVSADLEAFAQEMHKRQRFVDRPEEYRRLSQACGGAAARLLRQQTTDDR
jgi:hypothetical protein